MEEYRVLSLIIPAEYSIPSIDRIQLSTRGRMLVRTCEPHIVQYKRRSRNVQFDQCAARPGRILYVHVTSDRSLSSNF